MPINIRKRASTISKLFLQIDTKSLYFNIKNDNKTGHTPTVASPLVQGNSVHTELAQILQIPEHINPISKEQFSGEVLSKSRVPAKINKVFLFNRLAVNGIELKNVPTFCIYIREETDPNNVHCGRQKVHYPQSLFFSDTDTEIDNRAVYSAVSLALHGYAFIIEGFEYDTISERLNMKAIIVGENGIPYSKVFLNKRGTGSKFTKVFSEYSDMYDSEIIATREHLGFEAVYPENFNEVVEQNKLIAERITVSELERAGMTSIRSLSKEYPYSLYDIEYEEDGKKKFIIIRVTSTRIQYFSLSVSKSRFIYVFAPNVNLALVTDINGNPKLSFYSAEQIKSMTKTITAVTYENRVMN